MTLSGLVNTQMTKTFSHLETTKPHLHYTCYLLNCFAYLYLSALETNLILQSIEEQYLAFIHALLVKLWLNWQTRQTQNLKGCNVVYDKVCPPFWYRTFWQESFRHRCFITGTFRHVHHSALQTFRQIDNSTREHFDMGAFWHQDFSA